MGARKQLTPEFKREAVQLLESGSRSASEIARELGSARNQLYKWQTELRAWGTGAFPGSGARKERTTEITRLKRELARVTEERDILKKAAAYSPRMCGEVRVHADASGGVSGDSHVSRCCRSAGVASMPGSGVGPVAARRPTSDSSSGCASCISRRARAYGARKMWQLLTREGLVCGRHRVVRLRLMAGSMALRRRRYVCTVQVRQHETPGDSESPQPTVCRVGEESRVG